MSTQFSPGAKLRSAWRDEILQMPGVFSPLVARMAERAGFRAIYLSGAALSAGLAVPDIGLLTMSEFVAHARSITDATGLPLLADIDTGFGGPLNVERAVQQFERAGAAGVQIEDQQLPKKCGHLSGKVLAPAGEMAQKIRAATGARKDASFVIVARTDARGVTDFDDAVDRALRYVEAGADVIFPEALESSAEFSRFAEAVDAPLLANMTEFGRSPLLGADELGQMGFSIVIYPVTALRVAMRAVGNAFAEIARNGSQRSLLDRMQTRAELYDLLGYHGYETRDRAYFGQRGTT